MKCVSLVLLLFFSKPWGPEGSSLFVMAQGRVRNDISSGLLLKENLFDKELANGSGSMPLRDVSNGSIFLKFKLIWLISFSGLQPTVVLYSTD